MLELASLTPEQQRGWLAKCRPEDLLLIDAAFEAWHAKGQLPPSDEGLIVTPVPDITVLAS